MLNLFSRAPSSLRLGTLSEGKTVPEQLEDLKGKVDVTFAKSTKEIKKFRELSKFNEQLAKSYAANLKVLIETGALLKAYAEFFDVFKNKLSEVDKELGLPVSADDFDYMRKLTYDQMEQLESSFKNEVVGLKKLYSKYGKQKEYDDVENAEKLFDTTLSSGKQASALLKLGGGGKKKRAGSGKKVTSKKKPSKP